MKMNKKFLTVMMTLLIGGTALTGCGQNNNSLPTPPVATTEPQGTEPTETPVGENQVQGNVGEVDPTVAQETFYVVTNGIEMPSGTAMDATMFADTYGIDPNVLSSYYVQIPMMNVHATEVAVFELKDAKDADQVMAGIEKRQKALVEQWKNYLPEQLKLVENYKVAQKGNKIIFVISPDADKIIKQFEAMQ